MTKIFDLEKGSMNTYQTRIPLLSSEWDRTIDVTPNQAAKTAARLSWLKGDRSERTIQVEVYNFGMFDVKVSTETTFTAKKHDYQGA